MIEPRVPVDRAEIAWVVAVFYARVRRDPGLSEIFSRHVQDWPSHEAKIARFWANAILGEGSYSGNPMRVHMEAGSVRPEHFECWLRLFDRTLEDELEPGAAQAWSALAHRIGRGLRFGLETYPQPDKPNADSVPNLRV